MTADLKPYPSYKPSCVEWLGDVPVHWEVRRLKYLLSECATRSIDGSEQLLSVSQYTGVTPRKQAEGKDEVDTRAESLVGYKCVEAHDLVVNIMLAWNGSLGVSRFCGIVSPSYCVYRFKADVQPWYFHFLLRSPTYKARIRAISTGIVESRLRMYTDDLYRLEALVPPLAEQAAIVRYLDHTDGRIRRYLQSRERLIKLLKEYRQAVVHEAVTQGLDPDVPFKPSGIEWLGDIPAHWEVRRLKFSVENVADQTHKRRADEIYLAMEHVESWTGKYSEAGPDVVFDSSVKRFKAGDVLFGKLRPYLAKVTRPNRPGVCVGEFLVLRPRACAMSPGYLEQLMRSKPVIDAINASTFGAKMPRADWQFIGGMVQPIPPLAEQAAIVAYLDKQTAAVDAAMARARREIELLSEYRTRLIADVVTGQVDVREAVELSHLGQGDSTNDGGEGS